VCYRVLKGRYFPNGDVLNAHCPNNTSRWLEGKLTKEWGTGKRFNKKVWRWINFANLA
jgi:hypothetical protein